MAVEHAAEDQRCDGECLLIGEADDEVQVEAAQARVARRPARADRGRVHEYRHVEFDQRPVEGVHRGRVEPGGRVGVDVGGDEAEFAHRALELGDRGRDVLHRQLRRAEESLGVARDDRGEVVVVRAAVGARGVRLEVAEEGQRVGREQLALDAVLVHRGDPKLRVHKRAAAVADPMQHVRRRCETRGAHRSPPAQGRPRLRRRVSPRARRGRGRRSGRSHGDLIAASLGGRAYPERGDGHRRHLQP